MIFTSFSLPYGILMSHTLLLLVFALVCCRDARVQVAGESITVLEGGTTILPCKLAKTLSGNENLEQISWQRKTKEKLRTDNFFTITKDDARLINGPDRRFKYIGTFAEHNGTLQLSNVNVLDAGTYTCIFSIFPSGYPQIIIELIVRVPLRTSVNSTQPILGDTEVPLLTCTAAGFNPPAKVSWETDDSLKDKVTWMNNSTLQNSITTTTVSTLLGKPTREINRSKVRCVIISVERNETLPFEIQIYLSWSVDEGKSNRLIICPNARKNLPSQMRFLIPKGVSLINNGNLVASIVCNDPPLNVYIKKQSEGLVFTCETEGNPEPTITWSRSGNTMPSSVSGATLTFEKKSSDMEGLYQCEAYNAYGRKQSFLYMDFSAGTSSITGWICFIILFLIILAAGCAAFLHKRGFFKLPSCLRSDRDPVPTSSQDDAADAAV